ncbi:MAG: ATP-binding protein [Rhodospirillaceae bacterium]|nr:ATP-binding protein [Rhodospirillaceae bacterium]
MTLTKLAADRVGLPVFEFSPRPDADIFDFSSHMRAKEALEFALRTSAPGYNVFVVGGERSGRMTATLAFLQEAMHGRAVPDDWVYLNNFTHSHRPRPARLPAGGGRILRDQMDVFVRRVAQLTMQIFDDESFRTAIEALAVKVRTDLDGRLAALRKEAKEAGFELLQTAEGFALALVDAEGKQVLPTNASAEQQAAAQKIGQSLGELTRDAARQQTALAGEIAAFSRRIAGNAFAPLLAELKSAYADHATISRWLVELENDLMQHLDRLREAAAAGLEGIATLDLRYGVNLFVDRGDARTPEVVLEPNPDFDSLFGKIEFRQIEGVLSTDFSLIRAGALHRANGGVLVLRAEAFAADPALWQALKAVLRDGEINIEEHRPSPPVPVAGSPKPKPIPFDGKVVLVGSPGWYYSFFATDAQFQGNFKIKADIDPDMPADAANVACYAGVATQMAVARKAEFKPDGLTAILGLAARLAGERDKLSARFEEIADLVGEACDCLGCEQPVIDRKAVIEAFERRRRRNARVEDRLQAEIARGVLMIDVDGSAIGQVNGLAVQDYGDHAFGLPARVTARASVGRTGLINIERDVALGGPIQQKGVMVLQGFLAGHFARRMPLSFDASITFEQSYGGIEGDSASLAELMAVLSDLGQVPLRQDLAVTGSVNQRGEVQAVGGVLFKVEGFYRVCAERGPLTGNQGVLVPATNERNLVLRDEIAQAVAEGRFHIWSAAKVEDALELLTGLKAGTPDADGAYPKDTLYGRVQASLEAFDRRLIERGWAATRAI